MGNFVNTSRFALKTIYNHEIDFKTTTDGTDCTEVWVFVNIFCGRPVGLKIYKKSHLKIYQSCVNDFFV